MMEARVRQDVRALIVTAGGGQDFNKIEWRMVYPGSEDEIENSPLLEVREIVTEDDLEDEEGLTDEEMLALAEADIRDYLKGLSARQIREGLDRAQVKYDQNFGKPALVEFTLQLMLEREVADLPSLLTPEQEKT